MGGGREEVFWVEEVGRGWEHGREWDLQSLAPPDPEPPCRAFLSYLETLDSRVTERFLKNPVAPLQGYMQW